LYTGKQNDLLSQAAWNGRMLIYFKFSGRHCEWVSPGRTKKDGNGNRQRGLLISLRATPY